MEGDDRDRILAWVGSEVLPHEADVRAWLRRMVPPSDIGDIVQEAYCRLSALASVDHIESGRKYLFTAARNVVLERMRRSRIVSIEAVAEIDALNIIVDEPSAERVAAGRRELARVKALIESLPDRCRRIFELRKIDGLTQFEVAEAMGVPEHTVEYNVSRGLKLILKALEENDHQAELGLSKLGKDERARDRRSDR